MFSGNQTGTTTSTFNYDKNNHVTQETVTGSAARTLSYWTVEQKLSMLRDAFGASGCVRTAMDFDVTP